MGGRRLLAALIFVAGALGGCQTADIGALPPAGHAFTPLTQSAGMPRASVSLASFGQAPAPSGFIAFCVRQPAQCTTGSTADSVELTQASWERIRQINDQVNRAIAPLTDLAHYGRQEYWTIPTDGLGDCEDYALAKRQALVEAGMPVGALRVAVVLTRQGTLHAVLTVTTDHGDYVLDNLSGEVSPSNDIAYLWIERQDPASPSRWVSLLSDNDRRRIASLSEAALTGGIP